MLLCWQRYTAIVGRTGILTEGRAREMHLFDGENKTVDEPGSSAVHSDRGHPLAGISNGRALGDRVSARRVNPILGTEREPGRDPYAVLLQELSVGLQRFVQVAIGHSTATYVQMR